MRFKILLIIFFLNLNINLYANELVEESKIHKNLRCLVCQGQSIADSNSDFALTLKMVVKDLIDQGKTEAEIYSFLSDKYGDNADDIPNEIFDQAVKIVRNLVLHKIEYPDLTGYNFIEDTDGKVWIIDFGHARLMTSNTINNVHIQTICNGDKKWNPDFK